MIRSEANETEKETKNANQKTKKVEGGKEESVELEFEDFLEMVRYDSFLNRSSFSLCRVEKNILRQRSDFRGLLWREAPTSSMD